jgi:tRNA pseudouridine(55) synthase
VTEYDLDDVDRAHSVAADAERPKQKKRDKRDVHGWVVLDKPVGMTSTHAVSVVKRLFSAKRCGHAGTLDPLASGALPIALGEATKTVPFVMDGRKLYRFTIRWGEERDTDDAEGRTISISKERPSPEAVRALLPSYTGLIQQIPPRYSAIKIEERPILARTEAGGTCYRRSRSAASSSLTSRIATVPCWRPNAAKAPMCARSPAILAALWAVLAM